MELDTTVCLQDMDLQDGTDARNGTPFCCLTPLRTLKRLVLILRIECCATEPKDSRKEGPCTLMRPVSAILHLCRPFMARWNRLGVVYTHGTKVKSRYQVSLA